MRGDWRARAACKGHPTELWFPISAVPSKEALDICASCPVKAACLAKAVSTPWLAGVWGGSTQPERDTARRLQRAS